MVKDKATMEFRFYEMPKDELVLALLGESWRIKYGDRLDNLHFHNYMEIGVCYEGTGELVLDEEKYTFEKNIFTIVPPNLLHTTNSVHGTIAFWEWMYFDVETFIKSVYKDKIFANEIIKQIYRKAHFLKVEDHPTLYDNILHIMREMREKKEYYKESVKGLLLTFIVEILRLNNKEDAKQTKKSAMQITEALEYVSRSYNENIKVIELAKACNMSESHFRRVFLEIMSMKPTDYINYVRIENACKLIKKTHYSMSDIAYRVGFDTSSTFNRNFKKMIGMSPYQWKKSADNFEGKLLNFKISAQRGW